jgi:hypothetical protein
MAKLYTLSYSYGRGKIIVVKYNIMSTRNEEPIYKLADSNGQYHWVNIDKPDDIRGSICL